MNEHQDRSGRAAPDKAKPSDKAGAFDSLGKPNKPKAADNKANDKHRSSQLAKGKPGRPPVPDDPEPRPPALRRTEVLVLSLLTLAIICVFVMLYLARSLFLPLTAAFVIGTMFAPTASKLERRGVPRALSAVLIVTVTFGIMVFVVGLITSPALDWLNRLPELAATLKDKAHIFDRPLAIWRDIQGYIGGPGGSGASFEMPKVEWVQPTLEFLSPTFAEILLFFATLVLFIASWPDLRRKLVLIFPDREARLRTLRILNETEEQLGGYLLTVTGINVGVGILTGLICVISGMPNPAGLGALAATLNYIPIIGPVAMFVVLMVVGLVSFPTLSGALLAPLLFAIMTFSEGHFITPAVIGRRLSINALAVFVALAFWTWLWGPMGAFLSSPLLIVMLIVKDHFVPDDAPMLPDED